MTDPPNILGEVARITNGERRRDYGRPYLNHARIALRWARRINARIAKGLPPITPSVVVELMVDLKEARQENTPKFDNLLDTIGYLVCLDDMARQTVEMGDADTYEDALAQLDRMSFKVLEMVLNRLESEPMTDIPSGDVDGYVWCDDRCPICNS